MRIGNGWDLHRLVPGRKLMLGGYQVPSPVGEAGHSDGDVLIHAIIDAIYGALADGDIGSHYPDTDPRYKGIDSQKLLEDTMAHLGTHHIENLDSTVILQSPKLGPYKDSIRKRMSELLGVDESCFCIKAKTAEHMLGELGTGDAVVCQSACLVE